MIDYVKHGTYGQVLLRCLCSRPVRLASDGVSRVDCPCGRVISYDPEGEGIHVYAPQLYRGVPIRIVPPDEILRFDDDWEEDGA